MSATSRFAHQFVQYMPEQLDPEILYVSMEFATVSHLCPCGCGNEVVTPLSPRDWQMAFDGEGITLYPSIGNWRMPCRTHYWIRDSRIVWAEDAPATASDPGEREGWIQRVRRWVSCARTRR